MVKRFVANHMWKFPSHIPVGSPSLVESAVPESMGLRNVLGLAFKIDMASDSVVRREVFRSF